MLPIWGIVLLLILIPIVWYDYKYYIIPNQFPIALAVSGLTFQAYIGLQNLALVLLETMLIFIIFSAFRSLYFYFRRYHGLGFGDVKLLGASTLWVGAPAIPQLMLIATTSGLLYMLILNYYAPITKTTKIAFGPHVCLGLITTWMIQEFLFTKTF